MKSRKIALIVVSACLTIVSLGALYLLTTTLAESVAATLRVESQVTELEDGVDRLQGALIEFTRAARTYSLQTSTQSLDGSSALPTDVPNAFDPQLLIVTKNSAQPSTGPLLVNHAELAAWASELRLNDWYRIPAAWHQQPLVAYALPSRSGAVHLYLVDPDRILALLGSLPSNVTGESGGNLVLLGTERRTLYTYRGTPGFVARVLEGTGYPGAGLTGVAFSMEDEYYVLSAVMTLVDWSVVALLPRETLQDELVRNRWIVGVLAGSFFALTLVLFAVLVLDRSAPLNRILDAARTNRLIQPNPSRDEIDSVIGSMHSLVVERESNRARLSRSQRLVEEYLALALIKGSFADLTIWRKRTSGLGVSFPGPYFGVLIFHSDHEVEHVREMCDQVAYWVTEHADGQNAAWAFSGLEPGDIIVLVSLSDSRTEPFETLARELKQWLSGHADLTFSVGVSSVAKGPMQVSQAYIEAHSSLDYRFVQGRDCLVTWSDMQAYMRRFSQGSTFRYPSAELSQLEEALLNNDAALLSVVAEGLVASLTDADAPISVVRSLGSDIFHVFRKTILLAGADATAELFAEVDITRLSEFETVRELSQFIRSWIERVSADWVSGSSIDPVRFRKQVERFVEEHCSAPQFSIQLIADHFGVSISAFSRFYKKTFGINFKDDIGARRIASAKELLEDSALTLNEIVVRVGYNDATNFIRKFKRSVGMTPGQYRASKREAADDRHSLSHQ